MKSLREKARSSRHKAKKLFVSCFWSIVLLLLILAPVTSRAETSAATPEQETTETAPEEIKKGLVNEDGYYRYYKNGKLLTNTWKKVNGKKYYFKSNGNAVMGTSYKIDGQYYVFDNEACLLSPKKTTIYTLNKGIFCVGSKGKPQTGWQIVGSKLYSVKKNGKCRVNQTYQGIPLTKKGYANKKSTETKLKIKVMQVIAKITTPEMTKKQKLRACFNYTISSAFRYDRTKAWPNLKKEGWQKEFALDMLTTKKGVCFHYACAFAALAKELGYKPYLIDGNLRSRHCWVRINGKFYDRYTNVFGVKRYPRKYTLLHVIKF